MNVERKAVEKWLAQWGIHNDGEILGLLDAMESPLRGAAAQADTYPTPHDRLSAFIEGTFLDPEERDELRAALEALAADTGPNPEPQVNLSDGLPDFDDARSWDVAETAAREKRDAQP